MVLYSFLIQLHLIASGGGSLNVLLNAILQILPITPTSYIIKFLNANIYEVHRTL